MFEMITPEIQARYEAQAIHTDYIPDICGYKGRACRQMNRPADSALCYECALSAFADATAMFDGTKGYDYQNQAWVMAGRYIPCSHHPSTPCQCYGRLHGGEQAPPDVVTAIARHNREIAELNIRYCEMLEPKFPVVVRGTR